MRAATSLLALSLFCAYTGVALADDTTAAIMKWTKRPESEHPLPHACMGDLLRFKREEVDRWAQEEAVRRRAENIRKRLQLAS